MPVGYVLPLLASKRKWDRETHEDPQPALPTHTVREQPNHLGALLVGGVLEDAPVQYRAVHNGKEYTPNHPPTLGLFLSAGYMKMPP